MPREAEIFDDPPPDQVFLDDPLRLIRRHAAIPGALRIHHADGPLGADAQALALRAIERAVGPRDVQLLHPPFQVLPGRVPDLRIDAIRSHAHEQVTRQLADAERGDRLLGGLVFLAHHYRSYGTWFALVRWPGAFAGATSARPPSSPSRIARTPLPGPRVGRSAGLPTHRRLC